jgi:hypothetical protein
MMQRDWVNGKRIHGRSATIFAINCCVVHPWHRTRRLRASDSTARRAHGTRGTANRFLAPTRTAGLILRKCSIFRARSYEETLGEMLHCDAAEWFHAKATPRSVQERGGLARNVERWRCGRAGSSRRRAEELTNGRLWMATRKNCHIGCDGVHSSDSREAWARLRRAARLLAG